MKYRSLLFRSVAFSIILGATQSVCIAQTFDAGPFTYGPNDCTVNRYATGGEGPALLSFDCGPYAVTMEESNKCAKCLIQQTGNHQGTQPLGAKATLTFHGCSAGPTSISAECVDIQAGPCKQECDCPPAGTGGRDKMFEGFDAILD